MMPLSQDSALNTTIQSGSNIFQGIAKSFPEKFSLISTFHKHMFSSKLTRTSFGIPQSSHRVNFRQKQTLPTSWSQPTTSAKVKLYGEGWLVFPRRTTIIEVPLSMAVYSSFCNWNFSLSLRLLSEQCLYWVLCKGWNCKISCWNRWSLRNNLAFQHRKWYCGHRYRLQCPRTLRSGKIPSRSKSSSFGIKLYLEWVWRFFR